MALPKSEFVQLEYSPLNRIEAMAERLEEASPQEVLLEAFNEFGEGVAIATGFGAEGAALIDMAVKINPQPNIFFLDTGFLFPETYELRRRMEDHLGAILGEYTLEPDGVRDIAEDRGDADRQTPIGK